VLLHAKQPAPKKYVANFGWLLNVNWNTSDKSLPDGMFRLQRLMYWNCSVKSHYDEHSVMCYLNKDESA